MSPSSVGAVLSTNAGGLFGQPVGLFVLVGLKIWEVFSFAGMRAFLVLYMIAAFGFRDAHAALIFGSYGALVLATSLIGGFVADRLIGPRFAILAGAGIIMAGHIGLAAEAVLGPSPVRLQLFFLSLAAIAAGTGLLKPNVLTLIGRLYEGLGDRRRESGFYAYYLGVNVGGLLAPLVCAWLAAKWGWEWGFGAAALGMAVGLILFVTQQRHVVGYSDIPASPLRSRLAGPRFLTGILAVATLVAAWLLVQRGVALGLVLGAAALGGGLYLTRRAAHLPLNERRRLTALFALLPSVVLFIMFYEQVGTTITLFAERLVDRRIGTVTIATGQIVALNSLMVILLVPVVAFAWRRLEDRGWTFRPPAKFAIGFTLVAACFGVLALAAGAWQAGPGLSLGWIVAAYLLLTVGELCIAPVAYATAGQLAPPSLAGVAMGLTLLAFAMGNFAAGVVAGGADTAGQLAATGAAVYAPFFWSLAAGGLAWAGMMVVAHNWIVRRMAA